MWVSAAVDGSDCKLANQPGKAAQGNHKSGNKLPLPDAFAAPLAFYGFEALGFSLFLFSLLF